MPVAEADSVTVTRNSNMPVHIRVQDVALAGDLYIPD
jgi:hypothetical protein